MRKNIAVIVCVLILAVLAGCATTGGSYSKSPAEERQLDVAMLLRFEDIPVPSGFVIIDKESFAFQNNLSRVALLKYIGNGTPDQTVNFYKENMLMYDWSPINIIEYERRILNYENQSESCIVTVEARGRKSIVTIAISPKSKPMKTDKEK